MPVEIALNNGASTFDLKPPQYTVRDHSDVYNVGGSVGQNLRVSRADGTTKRDRRRDEMGVELRDVFINGRFNPDGSAAANPDVNVRQLVRLLTAFLEDGSRQFTMSVTDGGLVLEADVQFEEMGRVRFIGSDLVELSLLFTANDGLFAESS